VAVHDVIPGGASELRRDRLRVEGCTIEVPSAEGPVEIPSDTIRDFTDPEFHEHLANVADDWERRFGASSGAA
jgi:hypothetical protein